MWDFISRYTLRNRITIVMVISLITIFMSYHASKVEIAYEFPRLLPNNDSTLIEYENFKKRFGIDGAVMIIGIKDSNFYQLNKFNDWYDLTYTIKKIKGIREVVSVACLYNLKKNDSLRKFSFKPIFTKKPKSQQEVDSIHTIIDNLPFYSGFMFNKKSHTTIMAITFNAKELNSKTRLAIVDTIRQYVNVFVKKYPEFSGKIHYSGLPYIRTEIARTILHEMLLFMALAIIVTAIILFFFFRSVYPVVFSLLVVCIGVMWSLGCIHLFGYKITSISGLIPPLLIIIGIPNSILLLNKYHIEFARHGKQGFALSRMIKRIGISLFLANITTAIGFGVFCFTNSKILFEFGLVSSLNVMTMYIISLHLVPIIFSYLPPPSMKDTKHLQRKRLHKILNAIDYIAHHNRKIVYAVVIVITLISIYGITRIKSLGYVVDDLPENHPIYSDMQFFQKEFGGVLPFEITIDSKKEGGALNDRILRKINKLQKLLGQYDEFTRPLSIVEAVKFSNQAMNDGKPKHYILPGNLDLIKIAEYSSEAKEKQDRFKAFIDSTRRYTRVSVQMADIGSIKTKELVNNIRPRIDSVFNFNYDENTWMADSLRYNYALTGTSIMFLKGNDFLVENLLQSVMFAIILISLILYSMFMLPRMISVSLIPSTLPLIITAGLMGFFDIHLKPSTILIFSIAFGIASDGTLYFLSKYRQEFKHNPNSISKCVSLTIQETGVSMIYTAIILACGFAIFSASDFGGTAALGILISITLFLAYCSNLILLPCFLLSLEKRLTTKAMLKKSFIEVEEEEEEEMVSDKKKR
ncbi:MAG: MMPL family transporter [Bacteroidota bacterium]